jgi:tight adherence protein B
MIGFLNFAIYLALAVGAIFLADAAVGFTRALRGRDDDAVRRRLLETDSHQRAEVSQIEIVRANRHRRLSWHAFVPFDSWLVGVIEQSGLNITLNIVLLMMGGVFLVTLAGFAYILPLKFVALSSVAALMVGAGSVLMFLLNARSKRQRAFEEQLPDAIDLMVRSLKIGHPLSGAMQVIGDELPAPLGPEFAIACDQVTYGQEIAATFAEMAKRVGVADLSYLTMAVQIQQESGGNLVESLAKLASVIRDRYRIVRKVKSITVEGRVSAVMLSLFPIGIAFMLQLIKPDYFTQVMDYPYFPHLVIGCIAMLLINVVAMKILTTIKV